MNKLIKSGLGLMMATSLLGAATDAHASKTSNPGWVCVQGSNASPFVFYTSFGAARLNSAATLLCPLPRLNVADTMDVGDWDITVDRRGATAAWSVVLFSTNTTGDTGFSNTITVPAAPSSGAMDLDGGTITSAFLDGLLFVQTAVPAGAEIRRISVNES
jgi:hypothetical protein